MGDIKHGKVLLGGQKCAPLGTKGITNLLLKTGDLLYNRTNSAELVGKTGIYAGPSDQFSFASYLIRLRFEQSLTLPFFINMTMNSPRFRSTEIEPHLKQQCGQANVNGTVMSKMRIPLPPTAEQHRIVEKVDELMALCDRLKVRLGETAETRAQLAEAVVDQAVS